MQQEILEHYAKVAKYQEYINFCLMMGIPMNEIPSKVKSEDNAAFVHAYTDMLFLYGFLN